MTHRLAHQQLIAALWIGWLLFWWISSWKNKPARRRESLASRARHVIPFGIAAALLFGPPGAARFLGRRVLPNTGVVLWAGTAVLGIGFAISIWARIYLGGNWSGIVTIKEGHQLVRTGPYRHVRHPIYSGLLLAFIGTAITRGDWRAVLAVVFAAVALIRKLRLEDSWLNAAFGEEHARYQREVRALIPFVY